MIKAQEKSEKREINFPVSKRERLAFFSFYFEFVIEMYLTCV